MGERGQLSLTAVEAGIGVIFVLSVTMGFALAVPAPDGHRTQLTLYAEDTTTVLAGEPPRHGGTTRLAEVIRSEAAFEREGSALERRVERILPANLLFRVRTPHGAVGYRRPADVPVGVSTVATGRGTVTVWVWYA